MARKTPATSLKQISEINLTPLMDLTFILLITFIITFPLIEQGIPIELPKGESNALTDDEARTITVDHQGHLFLDDVPVTLVELNGMMQDLGVREPEVTVMVRADKRIEYGRVVDVLKSLHAAHITRMALVTEGE